MPPVPPALQAKIDALWNAKKNDVRDKLAVLDKAASALADTRTIEDEQRTEAAGVAHKLAGSLGMFGHDEATDVARAIEVDLDAPGLPQPERLREHVDKLQALLAAALAD